MKPAAPCKRCAKLEAALEAERRRVDKYADILFAVGQYKATGINGGLSLTPPAPPDQPAFSAEILRAIQARSEPNSPERRHLNGRAQEMLEAELPDTEIVRRILDGEDPDL